MTKQKKMYIIYCGEVHEIDSYYPSIKEDNVFTVCIHKFSYEFFTLGVDIFYTREEAKDKLP